MGDCLVWVGFLLIAEVAHIFGLLFPHWSLCFNFDWNVLGYVLGDVIRKLIWSPCLKALGNSLNRLHMADFLLNCFSVRLLRSPDEEIRPIGPSKSHFSWEKKLIKLLLLMRNVKRSIDFKFH
jgi:hypothetical protein